MARMLLLVLLLPFLFADLPIHCVVEDVYGTWKVSLGPSTSTGYLTTDCSSYSAVSYMTFTFVAPNIITDDKGNKGTLTMMYDEGMEFKINGKVFYAWFKYDRDELTGVTKSYCGATMPTMGWYHDDDGSNWGCFHAEQAKNVAPTPGRSPPTDDDVIFHNDLEYIAYINSVQKNWVARPNMKFEGLTMREVRHFVGPSLRGISMAPKKKANEIKPSPVDDLPTAWDWRDIGPSHTNYVSPVRDQGFCGSCYSFGATGALEARVRIMSNLTQQPIMSPQDIVSCDTKYSQACDGGFDFMVGKYAHDVGIVEESCFPYHGSAQCKNKCTAPKKLWKVATYDHVGGYYGACTADLMMKEIYAHGPCSVSLEMADDLIYYSSGVYEHVPRPNGENKFETTNHCVSIVGWTSSSWIVKNSWGSGWGKKGYFDVAKGKDEMHIESMAISNIPIL